MHHLISKYKCCYDLLILYETMNLIFVLIERPECRVADTVRFGYWKKCQVLIQENQPSKIQLAVPLKCVLQRNAESKQRTLCVQLFYIFLSAAEPVS